MTARLGSLDVGHFRQDRKYGRAPTLGLAPGIHTSCPGGDGARVGHGEGKFCNL